MDTQEYVSTMLQIMVQARIVCVYAKLFQLCPTLCNPMDHSPTRFLCPWGSPGKNTGVGCYALFQRIFPTQGSNPHRLCLLHCQVGSFPLVPPGKPTSRDLKKWQCPCHCWSSNSGERSINWNWIEFSKETADPLAHLMVLYGLVALVWPDVLLFWHLPVWNISSKSLNLWIQIHLLARLSHLLWGMGF